MIYRIRVFAASLCCWLSVLLTLGSSPTIAAEPIKIGFGMALTGALGSGGKAALVAMQIWAEEVNTKGGLLGRPVQLIFYDDQSNPATVPGIYAKLLDVDRVDLVVSGYGTGVQAAAMPLIMQRRMLFMGSMGTNVNAQFKYDRFFQILPSGPNSDVANSKGFFELAKTMMPVPKTVALAATDLEFTQAQVRGARAIAKDLGFQIVYDRSFAPNTVDLSPVVRAIKAANPEVVWIGSYPPESVAIVRAAAEVGLKPRMFGGSMVGPQFAAIKTQLGPLLNGIVNFDYYVPEPPMKLPGTEEFLRRYQERAIKEGVDQLGYYIPPLIYAEMQIIEQAVTAVGTIDQDKLADYIRNTTHRTIVGDVKYGPNGEWAEARILFVQFQNITSNDIEEFRKAGKQVILYPPQFKSGNLLHPYSDYGPK